MPVCVFEMSFPQFKESFVVYYVGELFESVGRNLLIFLDLILKPFRFDLPESLVTLAYIFILGKKTQIKKTVFQDSFLSQLRPIETGLR